MKYQIWFPPIILTLAFILPSIGCSCGDDDDTGDDITDDDGSDDGSDDDNGPDDDIDDDDDDTGGDDDTCPVWSDDDWGLTWLVEVGPTSPYQALTWVEATDYCASLTCNGFHDWRLPTISELRSLVKGCAYTEYGGECPIDEDCLYDDCWENSCIGCVGAAPANGCYWPETLEGRCDLRAYWSSSDTWPYQDDPHYFWTLFFRYARIQSDRNDEKTWGETRCVRGDFEGVQ